MSDVNIIDAAIAVALDHLRDPAWISELTGDPRIKDGTASAAVVAAAVTAIRECAIEAQPFSVQARYLSAGGSCRFMPGAAEMISMAGVDLKALDPDSPELLVVRPHHVAIIGRASLFDPVMTVTKNQRGSEGTTQGIPGAAVALYPMTPDELQAREVSFVNGPAVRGMTPHKWLYFAASYQIIQPHADLLDLINEKRDSIRVAVNRLIARIRPDVDAMVAGYSGQHMTLH